MRDILRTATIDVIKAIALRNPREPGSLILSRVGISMHPSLAREVPRNNEGREYT